MIAIDADVNQGLAKAVGIPPENMDGVPEIGGLQGDLTHLKELLKGDNPLLPEDAKQMVKSVPPGPGSHLIDPNNPDDPVLNDFAVKHESIKLLRVGQVDEDSQMTHCYHAQTGGADLVLNHLIDTPDDHVIVDMTAGTDAFASGIFTRFDVLLLVVEPTEASMSVYEQYCEAAKAFDQKMEEAGIDFSVREKIKVIGNKIETEEDIQMLQENCHGDLVGCLGTSEFLKAKAKGRFYTGAIDTSDFSHYEAENKQVLDSILEAGRTAAEQRDWPAYWDVAMYAHRAQGSWVKDRELEAEYDPEFLSTLAPQTMRAISASNDNAPESAPAGSAPSHAEQTAAMKSAKGRQ